MQHHASSQASCVIPVRVDADSCCRYAAANWYRCFPGQSKTWMAGTRPAMPRRDGSGREGQCFRRLVSRRFSRITAYFPDRSGYGNAFRQIDFRSDAKRIATSRPLGAASTPSIDGAAQIGRRTTSPMYRDSRSTQASSWPRATAATMAAQSRANSAAPMTKAGVR
jgi:hypothetical protein